MGNDLSSPPILQLSFGEYFVNGELIIRKYQLYLLVKKTREDNLDLKINSSVSNNTDVKERPQKKRKIQSVKKNRIEAANPDGTFIY